MAATVAVATVTCGFGVALISLGEAAGRMFSSPSGGIETGSANVFINSLKAAYVEGSQERCEKHPNPMAQVAEGSARVFINGLLAARKGDKLTCGVINSGSNNVFIGERSQQYLEIQDEVPPWLRTRVDVLMALAGSAAGLTKLALIGGQAGLKAVAPARSNSLPASRRYLLAATGKVRL